MSLITLFQGAGLPNLSYDVAPPGLLSAGSNRSIVISSGAVRATIAVYVLTVGVKILDTKKFAKLQSKPTPGWSLPQMFDVGTTAPVPIGGGGGVGIPFFEPGIATSQAVPAGYMPAPLWKEVNSPPYVWTGATPRPPFVPPVPIAIIDSGPMFVALLESTGNPVTFEVSGS